MAINRFSEARPAQDNYFNTFVPLPLEQLTAMGMARKQDLDRNRAMIDKAYNDLLNVQAMPGADETTMKQQIIPTMTDLAMKYANVDLTTPNAMADFKREMRTKIDPNLINRIEQSHAGYVNYMNAVQKLSQEGKYNRQLDNTDYVNWDSAHRGVFSSMPAAYEGPSKLYEPLINELKPSYKGLTKDGRMVVSVDQQDLMRVAAQNAANIAATPQGQQQIQLYRMNYPDIAGNMSDEQIIAREILDFGQKKIQDIGDFLGAEQMKLMGYNQPEDQGFSNPLRNSKGGVSDNFQSIGEIKQRVMDLMNSGNVQAAKDLDYKLKSALAENNLSLNAEKTADFVFNPVTGGGPIFNNKVGDVTGNAVENNQKINKVLNLLSSTSQSKYSFGSPNYLNITQEDMADAKKTGYDAAGNIINDLFANPTNHKILSINGNPPKKDKKLQGQLSGINLKDLNNFAIELSPSADNDYKPIIKADFRDSKGKQSSIETQLTDPSHIKSMAVYLHQRGDYGGEASLLYPEVAQRIENDDFDNGTQKYYIPQMTGDQSINLGRDKSGNFNLTVPTKDGPETIPYNTRKEAVAAIYEYIGNNVRANIQKNGNKYYTPGDKKLNFVAAPSK